MIKEAYCSFEVSKLLKEKGFNERSSASYDSKGQLQEGYGYWNKTPIWYAAPTHQMAMAWLREHGLHINASISYDYSVDADGNEVDRWTFWFFEILSSFSGNLIYTEEVNQYDSYEEAVEAALKYCLEKLI
jgi:hypothetical protein